MDDLFDVIVLTNSLTTSGPYCEAAVWVGHVFFWEKVTPCKMFFLFQLSLALCFIFQKSSGKSPSNRHQQTTPKMGDITIPIKQVPHPKKSTWNPKIKVWNLEEDFCFSIEVIFRFLLNLRGCLMSKSLHGAGFLVEQVRFAVQKGEGQLEWQVLFHVCIMYICKNTRIISNSCIYIYRCLYIHMYVLHFVDLKMYIYLYTSFMYNVKHIYVLHCTYTWSQYESRRNIIWSSICLLGLNSWAGVDG